MSNSSRAEFKSYCVAVDEGRMTVEEACEKLQICRATWYNWKRQAGLTNPRLGRETVVIDDAEFAKWQEAIARGEVTPKYVMEWLGISSATYYRLRREYNERNKMSEKEKLVALIEFAKEKCRGDYTDHTESEYIAEVLLDSGLVAGVAHWEWDENAYDWGIGQWVCSNCGQKNDNLGGSKTMSPYRFAGSHYCPQCGFEMEVPKNAEAE